MKILVKHFLCNILFLLSLILCSINIFAEDSLSDSEYYGYSENDIWAEEISEYDPFEIINRPIFYFNDFIYLKIMDPVTNVYVDYTPKSVRRSFKNFFANLKYPIRFVSNILQLKGKKAYRETLKFGINSSVGILGIFKPSDKFDYFKDMPPEDIGQVFASWGIPVGPYLVLPLYGPSTLRDFSGKLVEREFNPLDFSSDNWDDNVRSEWITTLRIVEVLGQNEVMLPRYKSMKKTSVDPYSLMRSSYLQQRTLEVAK